MSGQGYRRRKAARTRYRVGHNVFLQIALIVVACGVGYVALEPGPDAQIPTRATPQRDVMTTGSLGSSSTAYGDFLKPGLMVGVTSGPFGAHYPLQAGLQRVDMPERVLQALASATPVPQQESPQVFAAIQPNQPMPASLVALPPAEPLAATPQGTSMIAKDVPLPMRRPAELKLPATAEPPAIALRQPTRRSKVAAAPAPVAEDNRSFFQKLFGAPQQPNGPAMAYAAPEDDVVDRSRGRRLSPSFGPAVSTAQGTAIYDIRAKVVHMPNGEKLEAHSGLGDKMDDPRFVHVRMHGATPPHTYTLTEREALFHGHRALRMHPVGGSGAIYGRAGLLTHPYLLGPNGDSNGCVSFKDYNRFLQAYLRGEVKRLVVVASL